MKNKRRWSKDEDQFLKENYNKIPFEELVQHLNHRSKTAIRRRASHLKIAKKKEKIEYAVYKGDTLRVMGTAEECAKELGVTSDYIRWLSTPSGQKRALSRKNPENATTVVALEVDDE